MTIGEAKEVARVLGVGVDEVLAHFGTNVVRGPGADRQGDGRERGQGENGAGVGGSTMGASEWESEFMRRWVDLGMLLMKKPR